MEKEQPYHHGGTPGPVIKRLGIAEKDILDFSVNTSVLGPPPIIMDNWQQLSAEISHYPSVNGDGVAEYYKKQFGLDDNNILSGNGSVECLYLIPRVLKFQKVVIVVPSFHDYERSCRLNGTEVIEFPLHAENGFNPPEFDNLAKALDHADALMLGNPNNPTGTVFPAELICRLADSFPEKWILVDEAFIQFLDDSASVSLIKKDRIRKNLLIFHSLTKFYCLPGLRLGCVIGHPETIDYLKRYKEPWTVNSVAEKAALLLANCSAYENELLQLIREQKEVFCAELSTLNGIRLFKSSANFFLGQWTQSDNLDDLLHHLLSNGVYVRDCRNFRLLQDNFFRFVIRTPVDNKKLISLFTEILN